MALNNLPKYFTREDIRITGIYFLFKKRRLIYIGQTTNLSSRISQSDHLFKGYDFVRLIVCDKEKLSHYENRWIDRFMPKGNPVKINIKNKVYAKRVS